MWTVIIVLFVIIISGFLFVSYRQAAKVTQEGGMRYKYHVLIEHIMSGDHRTVILQETAVTIKFGVSSMGVTTLFTLTQTYGKVTVQWEFDGSVIFGKHKMRWCFHEYLDQEEMFEMIEKDLEIYQLNMISQGFDMNE